LIQDWGCIVGRNFDVYIGRAAYEACNETWNSGFTLDFQPEVGHLNTRNATLFLILLLLCSEKFDRLFV
jgi:hypothetical protein